MKAIKRILLVLVILFALGYILDLGYLLRGVTTIYLQGHTTAFLEDYKEFENKVVSSGEPQPWPKHRNYNTKQETEKLNTLNEEFGTIAFVIIKNDSIWFENYYDGFGKNSKSNSFSMAKSMVSAMLGKAIMEGHIKGLDQAVGDFFPEFADDKGSDLTVGDLSSMSSGLDWDEDYYNPFSITTKAYFYEDLEGMMLGLKVTEEPGRAYKYLSGNTQLLGMVIEKATGMSLSEYLSSRFWKPMGAENDALWQIDSEEGQLEKAYCCLASNALDFARFGKLYKDHGKWNGRQILDSTFISKSVRPRFEESQQYGYGWWLPSHLDRRFFMMRGHLGQYVIVQPEDDVIIVRLGHKSAKGEDPTVNFSRDIYEYIEEAYRMMQ